MSALPRFLCDEMLGSLCRYLRAAGYDTVFANNGNPDRDLLRQCRDEGRLFVTQDQLISEHKAAQGIALILPQGNIDQLAILLRSHYQLDCLSHAFTRCMEDNTVLIDAPAEALQRVPLDARRPGEPCKSCPACGRVYWRGSHYKRMHARLLRWQAERTAPDSTHPLQQKTTSGSVKQQ